MAVIALDLETELVDRALMAPPPVCMAWQDGSQSPGLSLIDDARDMFRGWLADDSVTLVGTFLAFDMAVLGAYWEDLLPSIFDKYRKGLIECVDVNQIIVDVATRGSCDGSYSLETLCERHKLPVVDKAGPWRLEFASLKRVPVGSWPQGAVDYVLGDADRPMRIHQAQVEFGAAWLKKTGTPLLHLAGVEAYKQFVLYLASAWGVRTHPGRVSALDKALREHLDKARAELVKAGLVREDGTRDTKAAKARLSSLVASPLLTDKGGISLDKEACELAKDEILSLYSDYSQASTLVSRVEDLARGVELPLQTRFRSLLETSRTSSSKPRPPLVGVQAQNFPRLVSFSKDEKGRPIPFPIGARECLEPRSGCVFVSADFSAAELHSLAQVCIDKFGDSEMARQLNAGKDLHLWFGAKILGLEYEEALKRKDEKAIKDARQQAKPCNFGFPGGMGAAKFVQYAWSNYRVVLTEEQARHLKGVWLAAFPEMSLYFKWVNSLFGGADYARFRHLRSGRWRGRVPYCATCNSQFQELTASGAADALCEVSRLCYTDPVSALWNSRVILYSHDEIPLETPEHVAHDAAMALKRTMEDRFNAWHPDCPTTADPVVSRIYSKDAKAVYKDGRLVPWVPAWAN